MQLLRLTSAPLPRRLRRLLLRLLQASIILPRLWLLPPRNSTHPCG
jgi:hypothetical protein